MDNIEITPRELYETLQQLTSGVSQIQTDILLVKMQLANSQQILDSHQAVKTRVEFIEKELDEKQKELEALEDRIDAINEKLAQRDRSFISQFTNTVVMGGLTVLIVTLLIEYFKQ